ncbi:hypothetical protein LKMONMHP_0913 [Methylobacterium organophilum]|uniref:Uncharacterized protein n=2 Tax=Methylobacterium organophilum TaxID=410 RepID=A0ABQ4T354_METOR|nr:hypothetical protein LKMONMHP_0913 [Methylobacterium organophilum]
MTQMRASQGRGRGAGGIAGLLAAGLLLAAATQAEAGCLRRIVNTSNAVALVSRDGGPAVLIPPHRAQTIRYMHPGRIAVALHCGPIDTPPVFKASYATMALIDRCYIDIDGGGTQPLTLNNPRQGDLIVGPLVEGCPAGSRAVVSARY